MPIRWKEWTAFLFVGGLAWGTSYLWIKIALQEVSPFTLVTYRMAFGMVSAWLILRALKVKLDPHGGRLLITLALGVVNTAIPILLISWAETRIDSGLAAILNSTQPLWTILIAHYALHDDRITPAKAAGLLTGFAGVAILLSRDIRWEGFHGNLMGQLAVVLAAVLYACSTVSARRFLRNQHPLQTTALSLTSAFIAAALIELIAVSHWTIPRSPMTWLACGWMGIIGLGMAYYAFFFLLNRWGATRTALVTFVIPVTAVILGVVFLGEKPGWQALIGGTLVISGIALVNLRRK